MTYSAFRDSDYTTLQRNLLREKGGSLQREFLEVARDSTSFIAWLEKNVRLEDKGKTFDLWASPLSEGEYKQPPPDVEKELSDKWQSLAPAQASEETFWGHVTLEHIKQGIIEAPYLAANGGNLSGGLERIDWTLKENEEKAIDSAVRTILRRLSGLYERGSRTVYVDCPFARAWWRGYIAKEICKETDANYDKIVETLSVTSTYWEKLIVLIVSRNSVLGDSNVRTALIWALSELNKNEYDKQIFESDGIVKVSRQIGIRTAWQELGIFSVKDLKKIMKQEFLSQFAV